MSLNYNKWDKLDELRYLLSDESDVEVHPNVDKKSFIRWKQRDIHEKREERRRRIAFHESEIALNNTLLPRLDTLISKVGSEGTAYFERHMAELKSTKDRPDAEKPPGSKPDQPSYDDMIYHLMNTVATEVQEKKITDSTERSRELEKTLKVHRKQLADRTEHCKKEIEREQAEAKKLITSEDIHEGFSSGHVNKNAATAQIVDPVKPAPKVKAQKKTEKTTQIETLNPQSSGSQADAGPSQSGYAPDTEVAKLNVADAHDDEDEDDEDDEEVPTLTPSAKQFTKLEVGNWEQAFNALSKEPTLLKEDVNDAILMEAFEAGMRGEKKYLYACVHQALVLQYCRKLGKDGVALFFKRMATNNDALKVFRDDVQQTYDRIAKRSVEMLAERTEAGVNSQGEREQIQLVASDPGTTITFEVPDGPPPETITLEGEGSESMDPVVVRDFLQKRWDIFTSFPKNLQKALKSKSLEDVNKVLGRMAVEEGEETVKQLDEAGILSFGSTDIVDKTGKEESST